MEKMSVIDTKDTRIIDTIKCNGKYTDVSTIRNRLLAFGAVIIGLGLFVGAQILIF